MSAITAAHAAATASWLLEAIEHGRPIRHGHIRMAAELLQASAVAIDSDHAPTPPPPRPPQVRRQHRNP